MLRESGPTKTELADRIQEIEVLLEEALDPELSREELRAKMKEMQKVANVKDEAEDEDEEGADDDDEEDGLD